MVLITGAGAGIGMALARNLSKRGDRVYAGVRNMKRAQIDFADAPDHLKYIKLDVHKDTDTRQALKKIQKECGRLDALVNNAGYGAYGVFEELSEPQLRAQFETNFFGVARLCRAVLPLMRTQGYGSIYNIGSILGRLAIPTGTAYTASKFALEGFSESLRYEVFAFGIKVVLIEPGLVRSNFKPNMEFSTQIDSPRSPYAFLNQMVYRKYDGYNISTARAAQKIARIMAKKRPGTRYRIGLDAHLGNLLRRQLPDICIDGLIKILVRRAHRKQTK